MRDRMFEVSLYLTQRLRHDLGNSPFTDGAPITFCQFTRIVCLSQRKVLRPTFSFQVLDWQAAAAETTEATHA